MAGRKKLEQVTLQPGQAYTQDRFGYRHPLVVETDTRAIEIPEGIPTTDWTNAQIDAYAGREGIDTSGSKNKADRLSAIETHRAATQPA